MFRRDGGAHLIFWQRPFVHQTGCSSVRSRSRTETPSNPAAFDSDIAPIAAQRAAATFETARFQVKGFLAGVAERVEQPGRAGLERLRGKRLERVLRAVFYLEIAHLRGAATC